jgi:hypothetical protein
MSQDGYTLAETLAALMIIGLAIGGLTEGMRTLGLIQASAGHAMADGRALRGAHEALGRLLDGQGPFTTGDPRGFSGAAQRFSFDCAASQSCAAALSPTPTGEMLSVTGPSGAADSVILRGVSSARFSFEGSASVGPVWPPATPDGTVQSQTLRAVTVIGAGPAGEAPITRARIWAEQPSTCAFDIIGQICRTAVAPSTVAP